MSSGSYLQVYVKCPFYKTDDGSRRIKCEGLTGERSSIVLIFRNRDELLAQMKTCCSQYHHCSVFKIVMDKYREDDET